VETRKVTGLVRGVVAMCALTLVACGSATAENEERFVFFNYWTSPGELMALNRLVGVYTARYPDVAVENAVVTGGPATSLRDRLYTMGLEVSNPPDSYQIHVGAELRPDFPYLQPIDDLYAANGWANVFPDAILEASRINGSYYTVPINVHRSNVLWYRIDQLAKVNRPPPTTWDEFFETAEALRAINEEVFVYNPARDPSNPANRVSWTSHHMFESILLAEVGAEKWNALFQGLYPWNSIEVIEAFRKLKRLITYAKPTIDMPGYNLKAMTEEPRPAAMALMGDWAEGDLTALGFQAGIDFGWTAAPGTGDYFLYLADSFPLPKGAPHEKNARRWLEVVGSKEGQDAFNPAKGSIPARKDADVAKYNDYHRSAMADFVGKTLVPSLAHGVAAPNTFKEQYFQIVGRFLDHGDEELAAQELAMACTPNCN
jgi:glucose/mannose transport system substrate-binding protein